MLAAFSLSRNLWCWWKWDSKINYLLNRWRATDECIRNQTAKLPSNQHKWRNRASSRLISTISLYFRSMATDWPLGCLHRSNASSVSLHRRSRSWSKLHFAQWKMELFSWEESKRTTLNEFSLWDFGQLRSQKQFLIVRKRVQIYCIRQKQNRM